MKYEDYQVELRKGICRVIFTKVDESQRVMLCTLEPSLIPEDMMPKDKPLEEKLEEQKSPDYVRAFDVEAGGWRSFCMDRVVSFDGVESV